MDAERRDGRCCFLRHAGRRPAPAVAATQQDLMGRVAEDEARYRLSTVFVHDVRDLETFVVERVFQRHGSRA